MSYRRVIPRDLFNEASLLKCLGQLWIKLDGANLNASLEFLDEGEPEPFDIIQDSNSGNLSVRNIAFLLGRKRYGLERPLNSRQPWPLWVVAMEDDDDPDFETFEVFEGEGNLSAEFIAKARERGYRRGRSDYAAIRDEANDPATEPVEVTMEEMWDMLEVVPPIYVRGGFLVGECTTSDARGDVYAHFAERNGKAFARYAVRGKPETYIK